jgi:hypothetical protein
VILLGRHEALPRSRYPLELLPTTFLEGQLGSDHHILHRARNEDLAWARQRRHPGTDGHRQPGGVIADDLALAGVRPARTACLPGLGGDSRLHSVRQTGHGGQRLRRWGLPWFTGLLFGLASGFVYLLLHRLLPAGWGGSLAYGALLLVVAGVRLEPLRRSNPDFALVGPGWVSVTTLALLVVFHGMLVAALTGRFSRAAPLFAAEPRCCCSCCFRRW